MSKGRKSDPIDPADYKVRDLIWAKMKGFTPWPAMIVDPPADLIVQPRKQITKCVFFFGSRNYAWIELPNIKHYEGSWKDELIKSNKPLAFKQALEDILKYLDDPTEINLQLEKDAVKGSMSTEADFDKIRDGTESDDGDSNVPSISGKSTGKAKSQAAKSKTKTKSAAATPKRRKSTTRVENSKRKRNGSTAETTYDMNNIDEILTTLPTSPVSTTKRKIPQSLTTIGTTNRRSRVTLLDRPTVPRPEAHVINMNARSQILTERNITPSSKKLGFLGLGIMGSTIVKDLLCSGHKVVVWNRTPKKCEPFVEAGAEVKTTPMDVVDAADIIFCCVADPKTSKELVFGNCGVLQSGNLSTKSYVEMSTIDPETSQDIAEGINQAGGRYLEAQIHGTRQEAEDGMLIILAGGDRTVFEDCSSCFKTIAKNTFFLGDVGNACKVNLILQTIVGVSLAGMAEALALADRFSISLKDILDIFELTSVQSTLMLAKGKEMARGIFNPQLPLCHMQKDLRLILGMAEQLDQTMPVTATTNEVFKHSKRLGYDEHDASAIFVRSRL